MALVLGMGVGGVQLFSQPTFVLVLLAVVTGGGAMLLWQRGRYRVAWAVVVAAGLAVVIGLITLIYALAAAFASGPDW